MASSQPGTSVADTRMPPILTLFLASTSPRRIIIRPYRTSDIPSIAREANNPNVVANLTDRFPQPYTLAAAEWWVRHCRDQSTWKHSSILGRKVAVKYAIAIGTSKDGVEAQVQQREEDEDEDVVIGAIGLDFKTDVRWRSAEFGYWLGEGYWGGGIMGAAVRAFMPWVWTTFGEEELVRLTAEVFAWNPTSVKVLQRAGFEVEGQQRLAICKNGRLGDAVLLGLVRPGMVGGEDDGEKVGEER